MNKKLNLALIVATVALVVLLGLVAFNGSKTTCRSDTTKDEFAGQSTTTVCHGRLG